MDRRKQHVVNFFFVAAEITTAPANTSLDDFFTDHSI